ncbi:Irregular chiasm C-roughest protein [Eumeta japonica]|uniref:Irregular chiasm C-roughest protein n=1 Tax=Eumeta variegata TaxID=151549 RepID=A0A4C1SZ59_EUMVA|nr:Irregular chiasm C-roughest protein [Eumeta japonica]
MPNSMKKVAVVGSRVTLPCRVVNKAGQLQWTKDDFGLGTHRHLVGYDRYKMIGSDEEGDYSLDIREVTLDDDAQYQCQVSSGPRERPLPEPFITNIRSVDLFRQSIFIDPFRMACLPYITLSTPVTISYF